ncbi:MAG: hypothetical protein ACRBN8_33575 [Nannocystales bacterium]
MRWSILLTTIVLTSCFDPNDPPGGENQLGSGSSGSTSQGSSATSGTADPTSPGAASDTTGSTDPLDTTNPVDTTNSTSTSDTDEPPQCTCAIAAPNNWTGPVVVARGDELPDCVGAFTGSQLDGLVDLAGDPATCGCSCGAADMDCGDLTLLYRQSCGQPVFAETFSDPGTCHDNTPAQNSTNPFFTPIDGTESCPPSPTVDVPPPTSTPIRMCGGTFEQAQCGAGEQCIAAVPGAFEQRLCVARSGVHACPPAYPEQELTFASITDSRGCTDCNCAPEGAFECTSTLQLYSDGACETASGTVDTGGCVGSWNSFEFAAPTITGSCTPTVPEADGDVGGAEPTTLCCN